MSTLSPIQGAFVINNTKSTWHPIVLTLRIAYGTYLLAFKVVQSQAEETSDEVTVFSMVRHSSPVFLARSTFI